MVHTVFIVYFVSDIPKYQVDAFDPHDAWQIFLTKVS